MADLTSERGAGTCLNRLLDMIICSNLSWEVNLSRLTCHRANPIFWTRALNIPLPRSCVFPENHEPQDSTPNNGSSGNHTYNEELTSNNGGRAWSLKVSKARLLQSLPVQYKMRLFGLRALSLL